MVKRLYKRAEHTAISSTHFFEGKNCVDTVSIGGGGDLFIAQI